MKTLNDFSLTALNGEPLPSFEGRVVLVVNVASKCGLTPQYSALEQLQQQFGARGFTVLGAPCNQFGGQEPGSPEEIQTFCSTNYGVSFPLTEKLEVNGAGRHALYQWLVGDGDDIGWNFEKFLIGRDGKILSRFAPRTTPDDAVVIGAIERALAED